VETCGDSSESEKRREEEEEEGVVLHVQDQMHQGRVHIICIKCCILDVELIILIDLVFWYAHHELRVVFPVHHVTERGHNSMILGAVSATQFVPKPQIPGFFGHFPGSRRENDRKIQEFAASARTVWPKRPPESLNYGRVR